MKQQVELFRQQLAAFVPEQRLISDLSRRVAFSTDASFYQQVPELVVQIATLDELQKLLRCATSLRVAVTFRAAGTSLSGQAVSDSVLVMLTRDWQGVEILEQGQSIRLQPGVIGAEANRRLLPYGRKIGPDPASINSCKIGGIAANNASGMCCGINNNSYHTLLEMAFVLADGTYVDTADAASVEAFRQSHSDLLAALDHLAREVRADPELSETIARQYQLKNTMGYGLNALLDYHDPVAILSHLLIGSEGTLAFIASITYRTLALPKAKATGLYMFADSASACAVIPALKEIGVDAVELMDDRSLRSVGDLLTRYTETLPPAGAVALLIELGRDSAEQLQQATTAIAAALAGGAQPPQALCPFTEDASTSEGLWKIRKGLFPAVGAVRASGTTVIIEDVAVPLARLPAAVDALQALFVTHGYDEAIIFGHALDGNVHFVFTQSFAEVAEVQRYAAFMDAVQALIVERFGGTLKAEHGTGRNMAPYVYAQWGGEGLAVMEQLKLWLDPQQILNPGVILNDDPQAHLRHLKHLPVVDAEVDACIECGFCESTCPSTHYTLSPRQRIALMRRQQGLAVTEQAQVVADFQQLGIDSCAATGLCATACPVGIDTGQWVRNLRAEQASHPKLASWLAQHQAGAMQIARFALTVARPLSRWQQRRPVLPAAAPAPVPTPTLEASAAFPMNQQKVVYFSGCPNRLFATEGQPALSDVVQELAAKVGIEVVLCDAPEHCCGQPWASKGYPEQAAQKQSALQQRLSDLSEQGRWPVIMDASPCALQSQVSGLQVLELSQFLLEQVAPKLALTPMTEPLMLHVTCSSRHLDGGKALRALAALCSTEVVEPADIQCCGFAGDKGFSCPELNASALASLAQQVPKRCTLGVSNSRTCELGLQHHSGIPYQHIAYLLQAVSTTASKES